MVFYELLSCYHNAVVHFNEVMNIQNFNLFIYLFFKNKLLLVLFGLFFIVTHVAHLDGIIRHRHGFLGALVLLDFIVMTSVINFVVFTLLSFEYFYSVKKSNILESLQSTKQGIFILYSYQFLVLLLLNCIVVLSYLIYNVILYSYYDFVHVSFLSHIFSNLLLNFFLVQLVAILLGWFLSLVSKPLIAYMMAIGIFLLGSRVFEEIVFDIFRLSSINLYPIYDFFNFSVFSRWSMHFHFGFPVLPNRFWQLFT